MRRFAARFALLPACLALTAPGARAAWDITLYPFLKPLTAPPGAAQVGAVALDEEVLASTDAGYANLRVCDGSDAEVPGMVRPRRTFRSVEREVELASEVMSFETLPDNRMVLIVRLKNAPASPVALEFSTPLHDFEKQVSVESGSDRVQWTPCVSERPIFDYSRHIDVRNSRVDLAPLSATYLRITVSNLSENQPSPLVEITRDRRGGALFSEVERTSLQRKDFRIDHVRVLGRRVEQEVKSVVSRAYGVRNLRVESISDGRATQVLFETARAPLTAFTLVTPSVNFSRPARVEARDGSAGEWSTIAGGTLSRIRMGELSRENLEIAFTPARRHTQYRVTIQDGDSPPLSVTGVEARGEVHELLFLPQAGVSYRLAYGARGVTPPVYDIAQVLAAVPPTGATVEFKAGPQQENPAYAGSRGPGLLNRKTTLVVVILAAAAALTFAIVSALRRMDTLTPGGGNGAGMS